MCAREACETSWTVGNRAPAGLLTLARRIGFPLYLRDELGVYYIFFGRFFIRGYFKNCKL